MFSKILVANRGEVAVRIIRACKEMGIETVAVYSEADRNSLPVALADERICIGSNAAAESYLNQKNIISAALATNAEAIHPGYGFLSENAGFAKLCEENGIVFIGPKSEVISAMGDKDTSRQLMQQVGVDINAAYPTMEQSVQFMSLLMQQAPWQIFLVWAPSLLSLLRFALMLFVVRQRNWQI